MTDEKRYYIAHTRGPDFSRLRERGFLTFYPTVDDYVFLECLPKNERLLHKQTELGIAFMKERNEYVTVTSQHIQSMVSKTLDKIREDAKILVTNGPASNLRGRVKSVSEDGTKLVCIVKGYKREYEIEVDRLDLVEDDEPDGQDLSR